MVAVYVIALGQLPVTFGAGSELIGGARKNPLMADGYCFSSFASFTQLVTVMQ